VIRLSSVVMTLLKGLGVVSVMTAPSCCWLFCHLQFSQIRGRQPYPNVRDLHLAQIWPAHRVRAVLHGHLAPLLLGGSLYRLPSYLGKRAAMARVNAERARLWHASNPAPGSPVKRTNRTELRSPPSTPLHWPGVHAIDLISLTGFRQIALGLLPAGP
jgi:hypothetical protein